MSNLPLSKEINNHFTLSPARLNCLVQIILGLIKVSSVNLTQLATTLTGKSKFKFKYRQLQRFFEKFQFEPGEYAQFIPQLFELDAQLSLAFDRTNWAYGKAQINILTLGYYL